MSYPSQRINLTEPPPRLTPGQLARRMIEAFPESSGPGTDHESGAVTYGQPGHPRIGKIPHPSGMDHERIWAERAEQERARAAVPPEVRAAEQLVREQMRAGQRRWA